MSAHPPPVPPANRSDKGPGEPETAAPDVAEAKGTESSGDTGERRSNGNIKQNTRNTGYQQDR